MSRSVRIALVGATGLIGQQILQLAVGREDLRIVGIARREVSLPEGARMEVFVAEPKKWGDVLEAVRPDVLISALGSTWNKSGKDEDAFRAVDEHLVLDTAKAAVAAGVERMIAVSSVGADRHSKNFYLRVKGEVELQLSKVGFKRLDILRPGLLRGERKNDPRAGESLAIIASPIMDLLLHGSMRQYRSIKAREVGEAALALALRRTQGRFVHDNDGMHRVARSLPELVAGEEE